MSDRAKLEQRGRGIAAMGLVEKTDNHNQFRVSTPSLRGKQTQYLVTRNEETDRITCNCLVFEENQANHIDDFKCEHILAVDYYFQYKGNKK